ncbi:MAG: retropepsin-like domain-containing protein [Tannerella sp.]|jgi:hypothetical protein|nr:retropepsin-like domain-containing protein [Tannerella sp.]
MSLKKVIEIEIDREVLIERNILIVKAWHNEKEYNFILDTGANTCVISGDAVVEMETVRNEKTDTLIALNSREKSKEHWITLSMGKMIQRRFKSNRFKIRFLLSQHDFNREYFMGREIAGILGANFLMEIRAVINFRNFKLIGYYDIND